MQARATYWYNSVRWLSAAISVSCKNKNFEISAVSFPFYVAFIAALIRCIIFEISAALKKKHDRYYNPNKC